MAHVVISKALIRLKAGQHRTRGLVASWCWDMLWSTPSTPPSSECLPGVKWLEVEPNYSETPILCRFFFFPFFRDFKRSVISWQNACQKKNVISSPPSTPSCFVFPKITPSRVPSRATDVYLLFTWQNFLLAPRDNVPNIQVLQIS